jgi:hypothetical protein
MLFLLFLLVGRNSAKRLSENSFVARASEKFSGKAARPKVPEA